MTKENSTKLAFVSEETGRGHGFLAATHVWESSTLPPWAAASPPSGKHRSQVDRACGNDITKRWWGRYRKNCTVNRRPVFSDIMTSISLQINYTFLVTSVHCHCFPRYYLHQSILNDVFQRVQPCQWPCPLVTLWPEVMRMRMVCSLLLGTTVSQQSNKGVPFTLSRTPPRGDTEGLFKWG